jgi:hypothetical protein
MKPIEKEQRTECIATIIHPQLGMLSINSAQRLTLLLGHSGSESLTTDGNKKMKTDYSSLGNGADTELSAPSIAVEQVENVEPDSGVSGPLLKPPRKLARSPSPTKSARSVSPMRSPAKAEQESCKSSPVRMEVSLDTPEINSMSKSASPLRQSQPPKSPVRLAAPTEPQPKPIVMQSAAGSEENTEEEGGEEKLSGQDSAALDSEPATPSMAGSVSMEESGGVDELHKAQFKWAGNSLRSLKRCNDIPPFLQPVDPLALGIPDYFNVIKNPMDISTIDKRLQSRSYSTVQDYIADVRLMLNNCFTYNPVGHPVYAMGKSVEKVFEATIKRMPLQV